MIEPLALLFGLLPVLLFLLLLVVLDSYKLTSAASVILVIAVGAAVAVGCFYANRWLVAWLEIPSREYSRYAAPALEETAKAAYVGFLIVNRRVGFMVDAAIYGFGVGAGFALVENIYYARSLEDPNLLVWVVRGFGTAMMHGSAQAIFAILTKGLTDRHGLGLWWVPGWLAAIALHSLFNHFLLPQMLMTGLLFVVLPLLVAIVFDQSERATRSWLGLGFDTDVELLEQMTTGEIRDTKIGRYLQSLRSHFPGEVVGDMLCYVQIHTELAIRAKGLLMAREAGVALAPDESVRANFDELRFLRLSIGRTGWLAVSPFLHASNQDLWQIYMLERRP